MRGEWEAQLTFMFADEHQTRFRPDIWVKLSRPRSGGTSGNNFVRISGSSGSRQIHPRT